MSEAIQQNRYQDNCLCKPLIKFHGKIVKTFDSLPEQGCVIQEIATRIIRLAVAILAYPLLGLLALAGAATQKKQVQPIVPFKATVTNEQSDQIKDKFLVALKQLIEFPVKKVGIIFKYYNTEGMFRGSNKFILEDLNEEKLQAWFYEFAKEKTTAGLSFNAYCITGDENLLMEYHADFPYSKFLSGGSVNMGSSGPHENLPSNCGFDLNEDKTDLMKMVD